MKKPLAFRMRPTNLNEVIGQNHLLGENKIIRNLINKKHIISMILYGEPGIGKTTLAEVLGQELDIPTRKLNAVINNKSDFLAIVEEAKIVEHLIVIMDEIHRLNKDKQDLLLPHIENGLITLIGMTTANPYHSINPAIRSRCHIFELLPLSIDDITKALHSCLARSDFDIDISTIELTDDAITTIATIANGDMRYALNLLELVCLSFSNQTIKSEDIYDISGKINLSSDKDGDGHYDLLSAFQKSIRGSDVDATLHYLGRLIESRDIESIGRRMVVIAYEDIGLASPQVGSRTLAAVESAERLGFPEARIPLANAAIELALSPKSNSGVRAIDNALSELNTKTTGTIPLHLKDAHYSSAKKLGRGIDYKYPHDYEHHVVTQQYLPDKIKNSVYYDGCNTGKYERELIKYNEIVKKINKKKSR